jgi:hypothetical protein
MLIAARFSGSGSGKDLLRRAISLIASAVPQAKDSETAGRGMIVDI